MLKKLSLFLSLAVLAACSGVNPSSLLVEAEYFDNKGGWVFDEPVYDQMGSAYLLAHGAGKPVQDATTSIIVPEAGKYHVWVRTFNWNAPWDPAQAPGLFQLSVNGTPVCEKLGDQPAQWGWQYAGKVKLDRGEVQLALHDLTGFEGRCDAIYLSTKKRLDIPADRGIPTEECPETYDLIVAGAGTSGVSAAVAAARSGLKVLLLDDKEHAGGNSSPEVRMTISGHVHGGRYPKLGNVVCEYGRAFDDYGAFRAKLSAEPGLTVLLRHRVIGTEKEGGRITAVKAVDFKGQRNVVFKASFFADCTGDANLGYLAGAEYMTGQETRDVYHETLAPEAPEKRSYGSTLRWKAEETESPADFPVTPWAKQFTPETVRPTTAYFWYWEAGFGRDQITEAEWIRDYMFRVIYGNWSYLKHTPEYAGRFACWDLTPESVSMLLGKRESRRLKGDVVFNQNDCYGEWERFPDAAVWGTYSIDQHFPKPELTAIMPGEEFESVNKHNFCEYGRHGWELIPGVDYQNPYLIPYRCLYSVNVDNMFMAGRNISGSRIAMCSYRVAGTCSLMGEVVGLAAALCVKHSCTPRDLYTHHLDELLASLTAGVPSKYPEVYKP